MNSARELEVQKKYGWDWSKLNRVSFVRDLGCCGSKKEIVTQDIFIEWLMGETPLTIYSFSLMIFMLRLNLNRV